MSHNATPKTSRVELRKTLTLIPVVMMGLAYMQPMTLFDTFGIVSGLTDGHVATAYAFALIAILFTALSYGKLVRRFPSAGSAYTYAQKSISPAVGFMVGWSSLLDYLFMPMINILLAKIYFEALVPSIPSWIFVVALVAFMTISNLRSIKTVANFNTLIVILQMGIVAVIVGLIIYGVMHGEGAGTLTSTRPFWSEGAHVVPMITGATILCFSFLGFDGISSLSEETKDAERVIPKAIFLILIVGMMTIVRFGEQMIVKAMSVLVFPFVVALMILALYLIPQWNGAALETLSLSSATATGNGLWMTLWLAIPVMVFSFNHSPIISSFAVAKREEYGEGAEKKCSSILARAHIMMVLTVMFFVFSCVLSLSPADLAAAKEQNISILSYLANHFNAPIIAWMAPIIAMIAITKSFLGHYLGAREGFNGMVIKSLRGKGKSIEINKLNKITALFMLVTTWIVATLNPSILGMIETLGGPIIAMILFLMPMYAIQKVPAMRKYSGHVSNVFVVIMGLIAISAIFYSLFS